MTIEKDVEQMLSEKTKFIFSDVEKRDQFQKLVADLKEATKNVSAPEGGPILEIEKAGKKEGPSLLPEFFLIIVGVTWLVTMIQHLYSSITSPGGTVIDSSQGGKPVITHDPNLTDGAVAIIAKDGTVEYKAEGSPFSVLMEIFKAVLIALVSGKADTVKALGDTVKDAVSKAGGDPGTAVNVIPNDVG